MARIRTLKPEFWTDEKIVELSPWARLLFIGLWNLCDDHGRMEYSPKRIKLQIFPADKIDVAKICGELREKSMIQVYTVEGHDYLEVFNFRKHQQIKDGDRASKFPDPSCADLRGQSPQIAQISQEGKGKEGKGKDPGREGKADAPKALHPLAEYFNSCCPNLPKVTAVSPGRLKKILARLHFKPDREWWVKIFEKMAASDFCHGKNDRGWIADFDWIIANDENSLKVESGKYDNRKPFGTTKPQVSAITDNEAWRLVLQVAEGKQLKLDEITRRAAENVGWEKIKGDEMDRSLAQAKFFEVRRHILNKENEFGGGR